MENMVRLIGHTLFVAGVDNPGDAEAILAAIPSQTPVGCMFREKGIFTLIIGEGHSLMVPFRKIRLDDPSVLIRSMKYTEGTVEFDGLGINLPDDAANLQAAYDATLSGMPYDWDNFLFTYQMDLERIAGLLITNLDAARMDGLQAQVVTDPRVGPNQVGMNKTTARLFMKRLAKRHPELANVEDLNGMWVLLQRYPVVASQGGRWVQLVILENRPSNKLFVNPTTWKELHGGDEDGDSGYVSVGKEATFGETAPVGAYPTIEMIDGSNPLPQLVADFKEAEFNPVQTAMNFLAKDATGPITHMFTCIARTTGMRAVFGIEDVDERLMRYRRALSGVYDLFYPMMEAVMDSRKQKDGLLKFMSVMEQLESAIAGNGFIVDPFLQFVPEDKQKLLASVFSGCNHTLSMTRRTAYGRYIAAGSKITKSVGRLIDAMLDASIEAGEMIDRLQLDATGKELCLLQVKQPGPPIAKAGPKFVFEVGAVNDVKSIFTAITCNGQTVIPFIEVRANEDGTTNVRLRIDPVWKGNQRKTNLVEVVLPKITKVGEEGHCLLWFPGLRAARIFKPIFRLKDGALDKMVLRHWLAEVVLEAIVSISKRRDRNMKDAKAQDILDRRIKKAVRELTGVDDEGKELLIRRSEFEVFVPESGSILADWADREIILRQLVGMGFDVVTTSKNKPGTVVTKAGKFGVPTFLLAMNPLGQYLDPKRRVEAREIRKALELFKPIAPLLNVEGLKLPEQLAKCVTILQVMIADFKGLNTFHLSDGELDCFDTLLCTESAVEKLAIAKLIFKEERMDLIRNHMDRMLEMGLGIDAMNVTTSEESLGDGLSHLMHTLTVECKITDIGKIKACVGPVKGVMNVMPHRLFAVNPDGTRTEIDLVVPRTTVEKKKAIDMLLYMGLAKAGATKIDPTKTLDEHVVEMQSALEECGFAADGTQTIIAVHEDGTEVELGTAVVGPLPFFRPVQTGLSTFDIRTGANGIKVHAHTAVMAGGVEFDIPAWVKEDFTQVVECRNQVVDMLKESKESRSAGFGHVPAYGDEDAPADIYDFVG